MGNIRKVANTDGILIKLFKEEDKNYILDICHEWENRTGFGLEFDEYSRVIQRDVNNYIIIPSGDLYDSKGKEKFKRKGAVVKKLSRIDYNMAIVNKAVVNHYLYGTSAYDTIMGCDKLIDFQIIAKISSKYEHGMHNNHVLSEKVHRCFASKSELDTTLYKKHKLKPTYDKVASIPEHCFIINDNITEMKLPDKLDRMWYVEEANKRISEFIK